ncbi:unnamed protein product, partial [Didymodactylos carnosus]
MIIDRGFRDVVEFLSSQGYEPTMPVYLPKGQKQHPAQEANNSRLITKVRWPVESYHGRFKKWTFFSQTVPNQMIPKLKECVRIVSAALNRYRGPIVRSSDDDGSEEVAKLMMNKVSL